MATPPSIVGDRFRLVELLGEGSFGTVHLATQVGLERSVAVKLLRPEVIGDEEQIGRFLREARITATVSHPNVVRVIDCGEEAGRPWIALEYLPGPSLAERLRRGRLAPPEAVTVVRQMAAALDAAHEKGILHRDVKPGNVLEAAPGVHKLTDFGIARWTTSRTVRTAAGLLLGTPSYMAPEYIRGEEYTHRSDLYALGVVFFELLTGRVPFAGASLGDLLGEHLSTPAPAPGAFVADVPEHVDRVVTRLLAKNPRERPASSAEVIVALSRGGVLPAAARSETARMPCRAMRRDDPTVALSHRQARTVAVGREPRASGFRVAAALIAVVLVGALGTAARRPRTAARRGAVEAAPVAATRWPPPSSQRRAPSPVPTALARLDDVFRRVTRLTNAVDSENPSGKVVLEGPAGAGDDLVVGYLESVRKLIIETDQRVPPDDEWIPIFFHFLQADAALAGIETIRNTHRVQSARKAAHGAAARNRKGRTAPVRAALQLAARRAMINALEAGSYTRRAELIREAGRLLDGRQPTGAGDPAVLRLRVILHRGEVGDLTRARPLAVANSPPGVPLDESMVEALERTRRLSLEVLDREDWPDTTESLVWLGCWCLACIDDLAFVTRPSSAARRRAIDTAARWFDRMGRCRPATWSPELRRGVTRKVERFRQMPALASRPELVALERELESGLSTSPEPSPPSPGR